jgi:hypothetical protein
LSSTHPSLGDFAFSVMIGNGRSTAAVADVRGPHRLARQRACVEDSNSLIRLPAPGEHRVLAATLPVQRIRALGARLARLAKKGDKGNVTMHRAGVLQGLTSTTMGPGTKRLGTQEQFCGALILAAQNMCRDPTEQPW